MKKDSNYWEQRCRLAEEYISNIDLLNNNEYAGNTYTKLLYLKEEIKRHEQD